LFVRFSSLQSDPVNENVWLYVASGTFVVSIILGWLMHMRCRRPYDVNGPHVDYLSRANHMLKRSPIAWLYMLFCGFHLAWAVVGIYVYRSSKDNPTCNNEVNIMVLVMLFATFIHLIVHTVVFLGGLFIVEFEAFLCCCCAEILCCRPCRRRTKSGDAVADQAATGMKKDAQTVPGGAAAEKEDIPGPNKNQNIDIEMGAADATAAATTTTKTPAASAKAATATNSANIGSSKDAGATKSPGIVGNAHKVGDASGNPTKVAPSNDLTTAPTTTTGTGTTPSATTTSSTAGGATSPVAAAPALAITSPPGALGTAPAGTAAAAAVSVAPVPIAGGSGTARRGSVAEAQGQTSSQADSQTEPGQHPRRHSGVHTPNA
jgi:hypothetical protein